MMKSLSRNIVLLFIVIVSFAMLSACGSSSDNANSDNTLELIYQAPDDAFESWMNKVKDQFEKEHDGVKVKITPVQSNEGDYSSKKILMMKTEDTAPDIVMEDSNDIHADSTAGYLEPLTDDVNNWDDWDQFYDQVKDGMKGEGDNTYGVPVSTDVRGLWYNKKVLAKAGIDVPWEPKTWDDVLDAAKKLKGKVEVPIWLNAGKAMGEGTTMQTFLVLLNGTDNDLYDEDSDKWVVKSDGFLNSLNFVHNVFANDLGPSLSWGITGQAGAKVATELMPKGEVGIALDGSWLPGNWQEDGNAPWPEWEDNIDIAPMPTENGQDPGHVTVSGGWTLAVPAKAHNKDLAKEFIKLATSKDNLRYGSQLTPRKDIAELDEYQNLKYQKKMTDFLEFTNYRPTYDDYPAVSSNIQAAVESVATGNLTPEKAMDKFAEDTQRNVDKENTTTK